MGKIYTGVSDTAREVKKIYAGVNGVAKAISKVYAGVNGVAELIWEKSGGGAILPDAYQQVEWIESTGTQYIDSSVALSAPTSVEATVEFTLLSGTKTLFGGRGGGTTNFVMISLSGSKLFICYGANSASATGKTTLLVNTKYDFKATFASGSQQIFIGNSSNSDASRSGSANIQNAQTHYIFARNDGNSTPAYYANAKLYSLKVYNDTSLTSKIRDFYPCYRKSDNTAGLYDIVGKEFYSNKRTTGDDFTIGPNHIGPL